jgi:Glyoxalase/Bleomycin resistance protein/Dioxygenase superfamily
MPSAPLSFGPIVQNGFVVRDLEAAAHHWSSKLGVGPFYAIEHISFGPSYFRGSPLSLDMSVAVAQWGPIQIELIVQHNTVSSIYTEFAARHSEGLQHVGVLTDSVAAHLDSLRPFGIEAVQWGETTAGMRFAYINTDAHPGAMIELIEIGPGVEAFFAKVRKGAAAWDGTRPLRRLT